MWWSHVEQKKRDRAQSWYKQWYGGQNSANPPNDLPPVPKGGWKSFWPKKQDQKAKYWVCKGEHSCGYQYNFAHHKSCYKCNLPWDFKLRVGPSGTMDPNTKPKASDKPKAAEAGPAVSGPKFFHSRLDDSDDDMEVPKEGGNESYKISTKERLALLKEVRDKCSILVADGVVESFPFYSFQEEIDAKMESVAKEVQSAIPLVA